MNKNILLNHLLYINVNTSSRIMKYILFLFIFIISCAKSSYSNGFMSGTERFTDFYGVCNHKDYIVYEFGSSTIYSVYIVKNDTHLDVYISNGDKVYFSTTCKISPIINWALEKAPNELASVRFDMNEEYVPINYKLTIMVNNTPIIIDSSTMRIIADETVVEKIHELKRFIISFWVDSLQQQNSN